MTVVRTPEHKCKQSPNLVLGEQHPGPTLVHREGEGQGIRTGKKELLMVVVSRQAYKDWLNQQREERLLT